MMSCLHSPGDLVVVDLVHASILVFGDPTTGTAFRLLRGSPCVVLDNHHLQVRVLTSRGIGWIREDFLARVNP